MEITLKIGIVELNGDLVAPANASGIVLFAHGSGSSRRSPRNQYVARTLQSRGLATLLFDLLTPEEERRDAYDARYRFDIARLAERLVGATDWLRLQPGLSGLPTGYFGASTGAAAALVAAAQRPDDVSAIVSRGGRPDLAGDWLPLVQAPTLLIVGGADHEVIALNRSAQSRLTATNQLIIVPGATHLFEEPGALDEVARLAGDWMVDHLHRAGVSRRFLGDNVC